MAQDFFLPQQREAMFLLIEIELLSKMFGPRDADTDISVNICASKRVPYEYCERDHSVTTRF